MKQLTQPLWRAEGTYSPISFEQAFEEIQTRQRKAAPNATLVMCNGDYSNEELYLIQRLARAGFRTNALASFDYYKRGTAFFIDKNDILPFAEILGSSYIFCLLDGAPETHTTRMLQTYLDACPSTPRYVFNTAETVEIKNYGIFFRCLNRYLIQHNQVSEMYIHGLGKDYDTYREGILAEDFDQMLNANHLDVEDVQHLLSLIQETEAPAFVVWERLLDERGIIELENLCMLLGIQARPSSGFLSLKGDLNSQGLYDMGIFPHVCVGGLPFDDDNRQLMQSLYGQAVETAFVDIPAQLERGAFSHTYVFNHTGKAMPAEVVEQIRKSAFSVLHTIVWEEENGAFDLIMPALPPEDVVGTFTDSARIPHQNKPERGSPMQFSNLQMVSSIGRCFNLAPMDDPTEIFMEYVSFFRSGCRSFARHFFR